MRCMSRPLLPIVLLSSSLTVWAAETTAPGVPISILVTHETKKRTPVEQLTPEDIRVREGKDDRPVTRLTPAGQEMKDVQLLVLIDDSARGSFGTQLQDLRRFITGLPNGAEVAVGYMRNGTNQMASNFTRDHTAAANTVRLAVGQGGADVSPYDSLSEAIKQWPANNQSRREVIMISSGIEGLGGGYTSDNPYVNRGIEDAQKAGVVVYTIYNPSSYSGRSYWRGTWGQNFLSQLADETGGEAYNINMGAPVFIYPFLEQIQDQINHQYLMTFDAKPENKAGMQSIRVQLKEKDGELAAPSRVYVKAGM